MLEANRVGKYPLNLFCFLLIGQILRVFSIDLKQGEIERIWNKKSSELHSICYKQGEWALRGGNNHSSELHSICLKQGEWVERFCSKKSSQLHSICLKTIEKPLKIGPIRRKHWKFRGHFPTRFASSKICSLAEIKRIVSNVAIFLKTSPMQTRSCYLNLAP